MSQGGGISCGLNYTINQKYEVDIVYQCHFNQICHICPWNTQKAILWRLWPTALCHWDWQSANCITGTKQFGQKPIRSKWKILLLWEIWNTMQWILSTWWDRKVDTWSQWTIASFFFDDIYQPKDLTPPSTLKDPVQHTEVWYFLFSHCILQVYDPKTVFIPINYLWSNNGSRVCFDLSRGSSSTEHILCFYAL